MNNCLNIMAVLLLLAFPVHDSQKRSLPKKQYQVAAINLLWKTGAWADDGWLIIVDGLSKNRNGGQNPKTTSSNHPPVNKRFHGFPQQLLMRVLREFAGPLRRGRRL